MFSNQTITVPYYTNVSVPNIIPFHKIYKRVQIIIINQDTPESEQDYNDIKLLSKSNIILIIDVYNYVN